MTGVIETRFFVRNEWCGCKYGLNENVCNWKRPKWNYNECWCDCKELDDWDSCENGYMWNRSACDYDCNKACKIDEFVKNVKLVNLY